MEINIGLSLIIIRLAILLLDLDIKLRLILAFQYHFDLLVLLEYFFYCPYCDANQLKLVDYSISNQSFIEDCEVCCNPIEFHVEVRNNEITSFVTSVLN